MFVNETKLRVRYGETDQMGYVYYGNYAQYFEVARVELLRSLGVSYKKLEEMGIILPVLEFSIKYFKPAYYDEILTIKTTVPDMPFVRIKFLYQTYNEDGLLLNEAQTTLVFVHKETGKPVQVPTEVKEVLKNYFS